MSEDDRERMDPEAYYDEFGEGEWDRLAADPVGRLEYENTVAALDAHLPEVRRGDTVALECVPVVDVRRRAD
jgi:hypothetical protein